MKAPRLATAAAIDQAQLRAVWRERTARDGHRLPAASFRGRRVLTLESRRAPELALLVLNYGGQPIVAPALREVPLAANHQALACARALMNQEFGVLILLTGVGTRALVKLVEPVYGRDALVQALTRTCIVARGPKPVAALRELGVMAAVTVPRPNTWRELIDAMDVSFGAASLSGVRVALQEYGVTNAGLVAELEARGAVVTSVPIYKWTLPENTAPLRAAAAAVAQGEVDVIILTAGIQLVHLLMVAADLGLEPAVRRELARTVIASIGPMTSEEVRRQGVRVDLEPSNQKMGFLVKEAAEQCGELLRIKRSLLMRSTGPTW